MSVDVKVGVDTRELNIAIAAVARGVKGGLKKVVGDSAGRVGVGLAKSTFPYTDKPSKRDVREVSRIYPHPSKVYEAMKESTALPPSFSQLHSKEDPQKFRVRVAKWFMKCVQDGNWEQVKKSMDWRGWDFSIRSRATLSDFLATKKGKSLHPNSDKFYRRFILLKDGGESKAALTLKLKALSARVGNGWVVASRFFRAGRSTDHLPKFKTKKQPIITGMGRWEGTDESPRAVLENTYPEALDSCTPGTPERVLKAEERNLQKQIVEQAKYQFRKNGFATS